MKIIFFNLALTISLLSQSGIFPQELKWRLIPTAPINSPGGRFIDLSFINENTGWVARSNNKGNEVFKTTNGGITWDTLRDTSFHNLRSIGFADSLNGWLGTLSRTGIVLYNTTNGGLNWLPAVNNNNTDTLGLCGISVVDKNIIYGCGRYDGPAHFYKTTNGGSNWITKDMSKYVRTLIDCYFFNKDSGFVVGGIGNSFNERSGAILFTSDGGETWINRVTTPPRGQWCWKISFPDKLNGFVSLEKNGTSPIYFLKTTDGGETWTEKIFLNTSENEEGIGFINANTGWIGGNDIFTYKTTDGGDTWNPDPWSFNLNRIRLINDTIAYAAGMGIYKFSSDTIVGISTISSNIPEKFSLSQNYPNPFNPVTNLEFGISELGFVSLKIFDGLGREVVTLVNENLAPGIYNYQLSTVNYQLSSGVYFYRLSINGFVDTKRMILLK